MPPVELSSQCKSLYCEMKKLMDVSQRTGCFMTFKLVSSGLGIAAGLSVFFCFGFYYQNVEAGIWALISAIFSAVCFHLYLMYRNFRLDSWHTPKSLNALKLVAIVGLITSTFASLFYFYTAIGGHESVKPYKDSHLLRGVWSFMTVKWSGGLLYTAVKYKKLLSREYSLM